MDVCSGAYEEASMRWRVFSWEALVWSGKVVCRCENPRQMYELLMEGSTQFWLSRLETNRIENRKMSWPKEYDFEEANVASHGYWEAYKAAAP